LKFGKWILISKAQENLLALSIIIDNFLSV